jgi:hypothetical protein
MSKTQKHLDHLRLRNAETSRLLDRSARPRGYPGVLAGIWRQRPENHGAPSLSRKPACRDIRCFREDGRRPSAADPGGRATMSSKKKASSEKGVTITAKDPNFTKAS